MAKQRKGLDLSAHFQPLKDVPADPLIVDAAATSAPVAAAAVGLIPRKEKLEAYPFRVLPSQLDDARTIAGLASSTPNERGVLQDVLREALRIGLAAMKEKAGIP